jgi:hypothetical protein
MDVNTIKIRNTKEKLIVSIPGGFKIVSQININKVANNAIIGSCLYWTGYIFSLITDQIINQKEEVTFLNP